MADADHRPGRDQPAAQGGPRPGRRPGGGRVRDHRPQGQDGGPERGRPARRVRGVRGAARGGRRLDLADPVARGRRHQDQGRGGAHPGPGRALGHVDPLHSTSRRRTRTGSAAASSRRCARSGPARPTTHLPTFAGRDGACRAGSGCDRPAAPAARRPDGAARPARGRPAGPGHARGRTPPAAPRAASPTRSTTTCCRGCSTSTHPLLTVVGGSTGAGKSTLVNSLVGAPVTTAGRAAAHHPGAGAGLRPRRPAPPSPATACCPGLPRVTGSAGGPGTVQLVVRDDLPAGLALLDAPDVDSVVESNRELAGQLLAAADLWVFVTTASRYADAVPWDLLRTAQERGTALAVVLDRVPPEAAREVAADLAGMLQRAGLAARPAVRRRGAPAGRRAAARGPGRAAARLAARAGRRPGGAGRRGPADADRRAGQPGAAGRRRRRRRRGAGRARPARCTRPPPPPTTRPARGSTRACAAAACCAARCSPAGRSSSAPASGCAACRPRSGRLRDRVTARRHRPARRRPTTCRGRWRTASSGCCAPRPTGPPSAR